MEISHDKSTTACESRWGWASAVAGMALALAYHAIVLVRPLDFYPAWAGQEWYRLRRWWHKALDSSLAELGLEPVTFEIRTTCFFFVTMGVAPLVVLLLARRWRPGDWGLRAPNRIGWRALIVGYAVALPFVYWMTRSPVFASGYTRWIDTSGFATVAVYYVAVLLVEHFFYHGALLAMFRPWWRWPTPVPAYIGSTLPPQGGRVGRVLRWIGLAQPTEGANGLSKLTRWIGLPDGSVPAVIASGLLFGAVHIGKDARELLLSLPGGIALAYLAYRTNSWLVPLLLHLATAATAGAILLLAR